MEPKEVEAWVRRYEQAWRTAGAQSLRELFTDDVRYGVSPWAEPIVGLPAVAEFWEAGRDGPEEPFDMTSAVVAVDGDVAVVRVAVDYHRDRPSRWRDLWVLQFAPDGRCAVFEEWPFAPGQPDGH